MITHLFLQRMTCFLLPYRFQRESDDIHRPCVITWHVNAPEQSPVSGLEGKFTLQQGQPDTR